MPRKRLDATQPSAGRTVAPAAKPPSRRSKVQSAGMGMTVLKTLAAMGGAASLTALATRLGESPAKVHRYLASLVDADLVIQDPATSRYLLGPESLAIGLAAMRQSDALTLASTELARLGESHSLSCFVSVLGNYGPTIVRWIEPAQPVAVNVRVGSVMPVLWSATGRAFGAFSRSTVLEALIANELRTATAEQRRQVPDRRAADRLFDEIRTLGCAPVRDLLLNGISAVAAPVFNADGTVTVVMTALGPTGAFDPTPTGEIARAVREAAATTSKRLGHGI
ncbi:MAG: IclR family transcriptional regulator [Pigmentiphaga sp.]|uniref:IclR family transcriptional regulator n=1 Tax=Pigmentiphaga sp. TaxID=1977564 RepID=UPI0029B2003E|nr:IclR family transcriptional regulator [Pigmentiphaga sp.]MDX3907131.1 IclR family transcriptional regulator [Pigmentiphaga sp.]